MSDEINIPTNLEEQAWIPVEEAQPEEHQQELPVAEAHETEVLQQERVEENLRLVLESQLD